MMKGHGEGTAASPLEPIRPEHPQRKTRLAGMDESGIGSVLPSPPPGVTLEHALRTEPHSVLPPSVHS